MTKANYISEDGVSVVIPFYNRSEFLKRLLDSIDQQTLSPEKIFIVDNGSSLEETNTAWDIIQSHKLSFKCSFLSSMKSGNANYARNLGYYLSETKYIAFLDSDDWWEKDHLSQSIKCLKNSDRVAVYSGAIVHSSKRTIINNSIDVNFFDNPFSLILSNFDYLAQTSSYVIDKSQLQYNVIWDEALKRHQDFDYFTAIFYKTSGWCYCPEANVNIDWDDGGTDKCEVDVSSLISFYEKWEYLIPDNIKKNYIKGIYIATYKWRSDKKYKSYYKSKIKENSGFGNFRNFIYIYGYIHGRMSLVDFVDFLNLRIIIKKLARPLAKVID